VRQVRIAVKRGLRIAQYARSLGNGRWQLWLRGRRRLAGYCLWCRRLLHRRLFVDGLWCWCSLWLQ
jgi:hypothetical protein